MKLPIDLLQKLQSDYVAYKYRDGIFTFNNIDNKTLSVIIESFLDWAENKNLIDDHKKLDLSKLPIE